MFSCYLVLVFKETKSSQLTFNYHIYVFTNSNVVVRNVSALSRTSPMERKGNVLFNDALNTFYLRLYGVRRMVKDNSDSERGNLLPPYGLLFSIDSKGSFICTIPQTG